MLLTNFFPVAWSNIHAARTEVEFRAGLSDRGFCPSETRDRNRCPKVLQETPKPYKSDFRPKHTYPLYSFYTCDCYCQDKVTETSARKYCTKPQHHTKVTSVQNIHGHCILSTPGTAIAKTQWEKPLTESTAHNPKIIPKWLSSNYIYLHCILSRPTTSISLQNYS